MSFSKLLRLFWKYLWFFLLRKISERCPNKTYLLPLDNKFFQGPYIDVTEIDDGLYSFVFLTISLYFDSERAFARLFHLFHQIIYYFTCIIHLFQVSHKFTNSKRSFDFSRTILSLLKTYFKYLTVWHSFKFYPIRVTLSVWPQGMCTSVKKN